MDQRNNNYEASPLNNNSSIPTWLEQTDTHPANPSTTPPKKSRRRLLIVIGSAVIVGTCALLGFMLSASHSPSCFDTSSYEELLTLVRTVDNDTIQEENVSPQEALYSHSIYFLPNTVDFDTEKSENPTSFLQSIGTYYQKQRLTAPISVQISTTYVATDTAELAQKRINLVKDILVKAGLPTSVITTPQPSTIQPTDESTVEENDDILDGTPVVLVSITPLSDCKVQN